MAETENKNTTTTASETKTEEPASKETGAATPEGENKKTAQDGASSAEAHSHDHTLPPRNHGNTEKTFTQTELDKIVKERVARASKDAPSKEDLAAFNSWRESQKSEAQKQTDALNAAQEQANLAQAELARYKQLEAVRKSGVDEKFVGYVNFEVERLAKTGNTGFDEALVTFLKTNANYKKQETRTVTVDTGAKDKPAPPPEMKFNFNGVRPKNRKD